MLNFKIKPSGDGWTEFELNLEENKYSFMISAISGDSVECLLTTAYYFINSVNDAGCLCPNFMELEEFVKIDEDENLNSAAPSDFAANTVLGVYKADFIWDGEGNSVNWLIEKCVFEQDDFMVSIKLKILQGTQTKEAVFDMDFRKFCYVIAKAFTDVFKSNGFCGYYNTTWFRDFNLHQFICVKAFALGRSEEFAEKYFDQDSSALKSSLKKELELIYLDME